MADVQLEHGHIRIANMLYDAIVDASFTDTQRRIVLAIVRLTYGWRQKTVTISLQELTRKLGMDEVSGGFRRSLRELLDNGVLRCVSAGGGAMTATYAMQKDFTQWGRFSVAPARLEALWAERPENADHLSPRPSEGVPPEGHPDPVGSGSMPPQGHGEWPHRVTPTAPNDMQDNDLPERKDRTDRTDNTTSTARARDAVFRQLPASYHADFEAVLAVARNARSFLAELESLHDDTRGAGVRYTWDEIGLGLHDLVFAGKHERLSARQLRRYVEGAREKLEQRTPTGSARGGVSAPNLSAEYDVYDELRRVVDALGGYRNLSAEWYAALEPEVRRAISTAGGLKALADANDIGVRIWRKTFAESLAAASAEPAEVMA